MLRYHNRQGISLVELSIVFVLIALLIGGIVVGESMLNAARLQGVLGDVTKYTKAIETFRDKYHELPGDMPNAASFWGADSGCPNTGYTAVPHTATCNGNGNGHIGDAFTDSGATNYEWYRSWQQLADAHMITGEYNGISGTGSNSHSLIGINIPASGVVGAGFTLLYIYTSDFSGDPNNFPADYGHVLAFGAPAANSYTYGAILPPEDAMRLDVKMDDGLPASGRVMTNKSAVVPNCTTSDTPSSSHYNIAYQGRACNLIFITGF
jgi:hypothetical protein